MLRPPQGERRSHGWLVRGMASEFSGRLFLLFYCFVSFFVLPSGHEHWGSRLLPPGGLVGNNTTTAMRREAGAYGDVWPVILRRCLPGQGQFPVQGFQARTCRAMSQTIWSRARLMSSEG